MPAIARWRLSFKRFGVMVCSAAQLFEEQGSQ